VVFLVGGCGLGNGVWRENQDAFIHMTDRMIPSLSQRVNPLIRGERIQMVWR
jgi:hypothetical protein